MGLLTRSAAAAALVHSEYRQSFYLHLQFLTHPAAALVYAQAPQVARTCPASDSAICYSLNIPDETASSGTGDIFFRMESPTTHEWVALGQGNGMTGSHIFIMYLSADGSNVTVSPRLGVGRVEPEVTTDTQIELLEGSGVQDGIMTANVRCGNCESWEGGSMDFSSGNGNWIFASKAGTPIQDDDVAADVSYHDNRGSFEWDFTTARGGSEVNPFLSSAATTNTEGTADSSAASGGMMSVPSSSIIMAHAVLACLSVAFVLPIGGILIRVARLSSGVVIHQAIQGLGLLMFIAAFGLGAYYATNANYWYDAHPRLGTAIFAMMIFQPVFGWLHHSSFKKVHKRTWSSWLHLTFGRAVILLGIINGGLGLRLGGVSTGAIIGYSVAAGIMGLAYIAAIIFGEMRRTKDIQRRRSDDTRGSGNTLEKSELSR